MNPTQHNHGTTSENQKRGRTGTAMTAAAVARSRTMGENCMVGFDSDARSASVRWGNSQRGASHFMHSGTPLDQEYDTRPL